MSGETSIGRLIDGRFEVLSGPHAVQGWEGCQSSICTRRGFGADAECAGWHCAHCGKPSSYQGHLVSARYVDGQRREFKDGTPRLSCQPGYEEAEVVPPDEAPDSGA